MTRDRSLQLQFFFFNDTATPEIYTLSLHDALPTSAVPYPIVGEPALRIAHLYADEMNIYGDRGNILTRSEEHTSELQSHLNLVCRLLLEKNNQTERPQAE